jgi:hypothetical protein
MSIVSTVPARPGLRRGYFLAVVVACGVAGGALAIRSFLPSAPKAVAVKSIADADGAIYAVAQGAGGVEIRAHLANAPAFPAYVDLAGMTSRAVGKALQRGVSETVADSDQVTLSFDAEGTPMMALGYSAAELRRLDYRTAEWPAVLDAAHSVFVGTGGHAPVRAWCASPDHSGSRFCAKALPK